MDPTNLVGVDEVDDFGQRGAGDVADDDLAGRGLRHSVRQQGLEVVAAAADDGRVNFEPLLQAVA